MDCGQLDRYELVEKYIQGQLEEAAQDEFEIHILECSECLQVLLSFQAVRDDLAERAHEIRAHPVVQRTWWSLHWNWVPVAAMLVAACAGGVIWHLHHPAKEAPAVATSKPAAPLEEAKKKDGTDVAVSPPQQHEKPRAGAPAGASHAPEVTRATPDNQPPRENANASTGTDHPSEHTPAIPTETDKSPTVTAHAADKATEGVVLNAEVEKELFRLGTVQPPAYTFSGLAAHAKDPTASSSGSRGLESAPSVDSSSKRDKDAARLTFQDAMLAYVDGRYDDAAGTLEQALKLDPKAPDANFFLGVCELLLGRPGEAVGPLETTLQSDKSHYTQAAHFYLSKAYVQMRKLTEAEAQLQAAAAISGRLTAEARSELTRLQLLRERGMQP